MLVRWSDWDTPFDSFADLRRRFDRLFDEVGAPRREGSGHAGRLELTDEGERFVFRAELPGVAEKDVDLVVEDDVLTLRAKRSVEPPAGWVAHRRERPAYEVARAFTLPTRVDAERSVATLEHGVLTVSLPKERAAVPRKIQIQSRA